MQVGNILVERNLQNFSRGGENHSRLLKKHGRKMRFFSFYRKFKSSGGLKDGLGGLEATV